MRRLAFIIAGVLVLLVLGVAIYFLFFAHKTTGLTTGPTGNSFGGSEPAAAPAPDVGVATGNAGTELAPRFVKITDGPVAAGAVAFDIVVPGTPATPVDGATSTSAVSAGVPDTEIRYADRASGNIYSYRFTARTLTRLTNRTLPGVAEASWTSDGSTAFLRFLASEGAIEHIETYALPVANETGGFLLERGLDSVTAIGTSTLYTLLRSSDGSVTTVAKPDGSGAHTLFSSTLSALRLTASRSAVLVYTAPSASVPGYAFTIDTKTGSSARILGPLSGLTALPSPSGKYVLFSYVTSGTPHLALFTVASALITPLPVTTLTEKCTWAADEVSLYCGVPKTITGALPDDWYQGALSFSDRIWKIDLASRVAALILDPSSTAKTDVDAQALTVDLKGRVLVFTNKKDGSLYAYGL